MLQSVFEKCFFRGVRHTLWDLLSRFYHSQLWDSRRSGEIR